MDLLTLSLIVLLPNLTPALAIAGIVILIVGLIAVAVALDTEQWVLAKITSLIACLGLSCLMLAAVLPSSQQLYTIAGGYYATNIEGVKDLPPNVIKAANKFLEDFTIDENKEE